MITRRNEKVVLFKVKLSLLHLCWNHSNIWLRGFHWVFLKPLLCFLGTLLQDTMLLKYKLPGPNPEIPSTLEKDFTLDCFIVSCIHLSSSLHAAPVPVTEEALCYHHHVCCRDGINKEMLRPRFHPQTPLGTVQSLFRLFRFFFSWLILKLPASDGNQESFGHFKGAMCLQGYWRWHFFPNWKLTINQGINNGLNNIL